MTKLNSKSINANAYANRALIKKVLIPILAVFFLLTFCIKARPKPSFFGLD